MRGRQLRGLGAGLWRIRAESYSTRGATIAAGTVHAEKVERGEAMVVGSHGMPATGIRPRPTREKGFPSNLLLDWIDTSPLFK
jgi:hypothetical protein